MACFFISLLALEARGNALTLIVTVEGGKATVVTNAHDPYFDYIFNLWKPIFDYSLFII